MEALQQENESLRNALVNVQGKYERLQREFQEQRDMARRRADDLVEERNAAEGKRNAAERERSEWEQKYSEVVFDASLRVSRFTFKRLLARKPSNS